MSPPRASVVIPVKNGAGHLPELLAALAQQDIAGELEVLGLDSGSSDGSLALLESRGVRTVRIRPEEFDHGRTRNRGVQEARGRYVVFLSQDAVPAAPQTLRRLLEALESDRRLAGAFARQVPRAEADPLTRRDLAAWVAAGTEPRTVFLPELARFEALPAGERYALCAFDNVASAASRELLLAQPFAAARFGEDVEWGHRLLHLGYGLAYVPEALVVHSHRRSARGLFRRNYLGHRLLLRLFGLRAVPDRAHLVRAGLATLGGDLRTLAREGAAPKLWLAAPLQSLAAVYGQYRGARDEGRGRAYPGWA